VIILNVYDLVMKLSQTFRRFKSILILKILLLDVCGLEMQFSQEFCGNLTSPLYIKEYR
jgi:hypothetical protein